MGRVTIVSSVAALLMPTFLAAQAPAPSRPGTPDPQSAAKPMTLTGCLRSTPNPDPAGSAGKPPIYTLEVMPAETVSPTATPPSSSSSGVAGTRESGAVKPTLYTLTAPETVGLAKHIEHRVEVTGQLQPVKSVTTGPSGSGTQPTARPGGRPEAQEPKPGGAHNTFEVTALKMISSQCRETP